MCIRDSRRGVRLNVVDGVEDKAAALSENIHPVAHHLTYLIRCAERKRLLRVHSAAPEDQLVSVLLLSLIHI